MKGTLLLGLGLFIPEDPGWSKGRFSFFSAAVVSTGIHWTMFAVVKAGQSSTVQT